MADYENLFADEDFIVEHLFDSPENSDLIQSFCVGNAAMGLEIFLKEAAWREESEKQTRTYLIKDRITGELACYFSMRTGLITLQVDGDAFDSLSAVDAETDAKIRAALSRNTKGSTVILVAHRITTLMQADDIIVMDHGRIAEEGSHQELIAKDGIYKKIYDLQMQQE